MSFCHLHCHDEFSLLDGFGKPEQYAKKAKKLGFKYLAITNHGNTDGAIKFQNACKENDITPIHGAELYIVENIHVKEKGEKRKHIIIFIKDEIGCCNLQKIITISNLDGFYYRPRVSPDVILNHCEGLIFSTACTASFLTEKWGVDFLFALEKKITKNNIFLEIMPHKLPEQEIINNLCIDLHKKHNFKIIATNDCHYIEKEDEIAQEVLLAIQSKKKWKDPTRWRFSINGLYLKTRTEMKKAFAEQGCAPREIVLAALNETINVAELCSNFSLKERGVVLPSVPGVDKEDDIFIKEKCIERLKTLSLFDDQEYTERLEEELKIITKQKFSRYFLIVWELVVWCKKNDIMVGPGRGSAGGSLVCYLLNITTVDPIEYNLIFARFISPARIDLPDIDMDFEDIKRPLIRKHLEEIYGKWNVCGVSTFSSLKGKGAIRDVSRVFDIPLTDVNKAAESIVVRSGGDVRSDYSIEDAFKTFEDGKKFYKKYPEVSKIAMKMEGQIRGKGQHAAAIIISEDDLRNGTRCSLNLGKEKETITNWDKHDIEYQGLMKLDILGLTALTVLNESKKLVKRNKNIDIDYISIPLDDERCFKEFTKGNNIGCFQVGSLGLRKFCQQIGVEDFMSLVHASALYRPGTLRSGMTTEFVKRKKKEVHWEHKHEFLEKITDYTYGIILYQEQVMMFMYDLAGLGWRTADTVRKVISKSQGVEQFQKFKELFVDGCQKKGTLGEKDAALLWDELSSFGSYGFNLSHAVEYSMITYWDMWMKINHPEEFLCASLTYGGDNKKEELVEEAIRLGIDVRPPKIGESDSFRWEIIDNILYTPFIEIKGIGEKTAEVFSAIGHNEEQGFFKTKSEIRMPNKKFIEILNKIESYKDIPLIDDKALIADEFFKFSYLKDKHYKLKNLISRIEKGIAKKRLVKDINFNTIDRDEYLHFGMMTEIKFGYRKNVSSSLEKKLTVSGQSDNLGGVYGNFKDKSDFCMLVFNGTIYNEKKDYVEHCTDEFIIAKGNVPSRAGSLQCNYAWFEDEIKKAEFDGLDISFAENSRFSNKEILNCKKCNACSSPLPTEKGVNNILVVNEHPSKKTGKHSDLNYIFDDVLEDNNIKKKEFNYTSVVKCRENKIGKREISNCSVWLDEEIKRIKPFLILAFGNTGVKYFTDEDSGILNKAGKTQWSEKHNAWICWCTSSNSIYHSEENKNFYRENIENFIKKVKKLK